MCSLSIHVAAQNPTDAIVAIWDAGKVHVEIYQSGDRYIGNPINEKGERIQEIEILNLEFKDDKWVGKLYAKKRDKYFDVVCQVEGDKLLQEVDAGFTTRNVEWTKVN